MNDFLSGDGGVPLGFGMALAQNTAALERFSGLSEQQRKDILEGARAVQSKQEMRDYVSGLTGTF